MHRDSPNSKAIDLSADNIEINLSKARYESKAILQENKFIKKQNEVLRKQLESLSIRLDGQIKKRLQDTKKKHPGKGQDLSQMELQNAYKKCQIYKKQASLYKKKLQTFTDDSRLQDLESKINSYAKDNSQMKDQIKQLKKITKLQQKNLTELGIQGFSTMVSQNQKLKQQVRILKKQLDNYRRALQISKKVNNHSSQIDDKISESAEERRIPFRKSDKLQDKLKRKLKTQNDNIDQNQDLTDLLHQKVQKDFQKMRSLANQKSRLRDMIDNLKLQLTDKQKQVSYLKQKISQLRKNNQLLQSQLVANRSQSHLAESKHKKQKKIFDTEPNQPINKKPKNNQQSNQSKRRIWKKNLPEQIDPQFISENSRNSRNTNYPRKEQSGSKMKNTLKWSHQHLSSKIKEVQILQHESGHIKDLHVRYQNGQPKKYDQSGPKIKYQVFTCSEDEYVKNIEGAFVNGYLQYLVITSNHRRVEKYGNYEQYEQSGEGQHFQFQVGENQFPGAFFGQSDQNGIRRLGCFIHKQT